MGLADDAALAAPRAEPVPTLPVQPWTDAPDAPEPGRCAVWVIDLAHPPEALARSLPGPPSRADRRALVHRRRAVGRAATGHLVAGCLRVPAAAVRWRAAPGGKPALDLGDAGAGWDVSVSRAGDRCVVAIARAAVVGVDIERVVPLPEIEGVAQRAFAPVERRQWAALPAFARTEAFFRWWTRKEAFLKANGHGLAAPLDGFDVDLVAVPWLLAAGDDDPATWSTYHVEPFVSVVGAVAVGPATGALH